jgi:dethiobiotin synthetase
MRRIFITATDTDAGKTYVTASLLRSLKRAGRDVIGLKPVASGSEGAPISPDVAALLKAQDMPESTAAYINLYSFAAALAPSQAAAGEERSVDPQTLVDWCKEQSSAHDISLIEGVGGLMVPLTEDYLVADWLGDMPDCEVMLVVRAKLGGINHALLTLDKLNLMGRAPRWIIINDAGNVGQAMLASHQSALAGTAELIVMPHGMQGKFQIPFL